MNDKAFPASGQCVANAVLMRLSRTLVSVCLLSALSSPSCAQPKQDADQSATDAPHALWKFDTGG